MQHKAWFQVPIFIQSCKILKSCNTTKNCFIDELESFIGRCRMPYLIVMSPKTTSILILNCNAKQMLYSWHYSVGNVECPKATSILIINLQNRWSIHVFLQSKISAKDWNMISVGWYADKSGSQNLDFVIQSLLFITIAIFADSRNPAPKNVKHQISFITCLYINAVFFETSRKRDQTFFGYDFLRDFISNRYPSTAQTQSLITHQLLMLLNPARSAHFWSVEGKFIVMALFIAWIHF